MPGAAASYASMERRERLFRAFGVLSEVRRAQRLAPRHGELLLSLQPAPARDALPDAIADLPAPEVGHDRRAAFERHLRAARIRGIGGHRAFLQDGREQLHVDVAVRADAAAEPDAVHLERALGVEPEVRGIAAAIGAT